MASIYAAIQQQPTTAASRCRNKNKQHNEFHTTINWEVQYATAMYCHTQAYEKLGDHNYDDAAMTKEIAVSAVIYEELGGHGDIRDDV